MNSDDKWFFRDKLIKVSFIIMVCFFVITMPVMIAYAVNKTVIVTEEAETVTSEPALDPIPEIKKSTWRRTLNVDNDENQECTVFIADVTNYEISVRYDLKRVSVILPQEEGALFKNNSPVGTFEHVLEATSEYDGENVRFVFELDAACECVAKKSDSGLLLDFCKLTTDEKPVVLIDPGHGGSSNGTKVGKLVEKNITLEIAGKINDLCANKDYRVILTRTGDETMVTMDRINTCEIVGADAYIGIHLSSDIEDTKVFGLSGAYNDVYFDRTISNTVFADRILKSVAISTTNKANGITAAGEEDVILLAFDIPSVIINAGYISNPDEAKLLAQDEYKEAIARGIVDALDKMYREGLLKKKSR